MATVAGDNAATSPSTQEGQSSPGHETGASPAAQPAAQDGGETEGFFHDQSSTYKEPILSEECRRQPVPVRRVVADGAIAERRKLRRAGKRAGGN